MGYDFDQIIDRNNTNSIKYDFKKERGMPLDIIPLWVADMDFKSPDMVSTSLINCANHGIFGYSEVKGKYFDVLENWFSKYFDFKIEEKWVVKTPGVVFAIATAIKAFTKEGDGVVIQEPVYYPFRKVIEENNRKVVNNNLIYKKSKYEMDFDAFDKQTKDENVKLFILCSPHNPVGRVWTKDELIKIGEICLKNNVLVVSDEIHCDFVYEKNKHHVFANINEEFLENTITCTSPSKTFNLAGLQISNIFIKNPQIRKTFIQEISKTGYSQCNISGLVSCEASYKYGDKWLFDLKKYLSLNLEFIKNFCKENLPNVKIVEPEGTYLVWLDFSNIGLEPDEINKIIVKKAGLWLDSGEMFGTCSKYFQRINIACPKSVLENAFEKLAKAFE